MPFFMKTCFKLRRKNKKNKKQKDMQTIRDVVTPISNTEMWQRHRSVSSLSDHDVVESNISGERNLERSIQSHPMHEKDNSSINEDESSDANENNRHGALTAISEDNSSNRMCQISCEESKDIKDEQNSENHEDSISVINEEAIENEVKDDTGKCRIFNETSNADIDDLPDGSSKLNTHKFKSCEIISNITVYSDVFEAIEVLNNLIQAVSEGHSSTTSKISQESLNRNGEREINELDSNTKTLNSCKSEETDENLSDINDTCELPATHKHSANEKKTGDEVFLHSVEFQISGDNIGLATDEEENINISNESEINEDQFKKYEENISVRCDNFPCTDNINAAFNSIIKSSESLHTLDALSEALENSKNCNYHDNKNVINSESLEVGHNRSMTDVYNAETKVVSIKKSIDSTEDCFEANDDEVSTNFKNSDNSFVLESISSDAHISSLMNSDSQRKLLVDSQDVFIPTSKQLVAVDLIDTITDCTLESLQYEEAKTSDDAYCATSLLNASCEFNNNECKLEGDTLSITKQDNEILPGSEIEMCLKYTEMFREESRDGNMKGSVNRKLLNGDDIVLNSHHQNLQSQEYIHCNTFKEFNYVGEITENDIYTCQDEYPLEENKLVLRNENAENDRHVYGNSYGACLFGNPEENQECPFDESLRCEKKNSNLIHFDELGINKTNKYIFRNGIRENDVKNILDDENMVHLNGNCDFLREARGLENNEIYGVMDNEFLEEGNSNYVIETNIEKIDQCLNLINNLIDKNHSQKSFKKCSLSSNSESSDFSESVDARDNMIARDSESFKISASGDNNISNDVMKSDRSDHGNRGNTAQITKNILSESQNEHKFKISIARKSSSKRNKAIEKTDFFPEINVFDLITDGRSLSLSPVHKSVNNNMNAAGNDVPESKRHLINIPMNGEIVTLKNALNLNYLNEIEAIRFQSLLRFQRKKVNAFSVMNTELRKIPVKKTSEISFRKLQDLCLNRGKKPTNFPVLYKPLEVEEGLKDSFKFTSLNEKSTCLKRCHKENRSRKLLFSDSDLEVSSESSEKMTPARKRILNISRSIRSPKYPFKVNRKPSGSTLLYRSRHPIIKPSKPNWVAYITKDEKNGYHIKRGYRICSPNLDKHKFSPSEKRKTDGYQTHHVGNYRAISPENQKIKFDGQFRKYAGRGRANGELISYKRSTEWLRDAGLIGKALTTEEANAAFKCTAGVKVALNKGDYRHFLKKLTKVKKLNYNDIYDRLCSATNECPDR